MEGRNRKMAWQKDVEEWQKDVEQFSLGTTGHGLKYIFHSTVPGRSFKTIRIIFFVVWLIAVFYSIYVISSAFNKYVSSPTGTKFQVIAHAYANGPQSDKPPSVQYPTISVCPHNVITQSYFDANVGLEDLWMQLDRWDPLISENISFSEGTTAAKYKDWTYEQIISEAGPANWTFLQCEQFIHLCQEILTEPEFYERETSMSGRCFRINPKGKLRGKGGDYGKLTLTFFADLNEYSALTRSEPQYGYTVVFHDHNSYSSTMSSGFWMSPGSIYKVDLSLVQEFRKPAPAGTCDSSRVNNTYGRYDDASCIAQCRDDVLMKQCGCINIRPPLPENEPRKKYKACTMEQWAHCGLRAYKEWVVKYSDVTQLTRQECNCPPTCNEVQYKAQLSSSTLSKFYAKEKARILPTGYNSSQDILENLMIIDVLFTSMQVSEIREIVMYSWSNFLGDVGGVMGLFLGASIFTILEFFEFVALSCWKVRRRRREKQPSERNMMEEAE